MAKLSHQNSSGIVGVWRIRDAARQVYYGLHSILHRGSDGVGIACSNGKEIQAVKGAGLLSEIITPSVLDELEGSLACGQIRMHTEDDSYESNIQPIMVSAIQGQFCVVSSSSLTNANSIREQMMEDGLIFQGTSDAEVIAHLIQRAEGTMAEKIREACIQLSGPYTFLCMTKNTLYAARSADGIRGLFLASVEGGLVIASETAAFNMMDARDIEEIPAGCLFCLKKDGVDLIKMIRSTGNVCAMEYVYYSRPDSIYGDRSVHSYRKEAGRRLAKGEDIDADIVIGVPDTAISAAAAFAQELKKPYEIGLIKNRYIGSTFVQPLKEQRKSGMRVRLNAISSIVKDKKVYLVDDSIMKGETSKRLCQLLREAGAKEVHLRIASPIIDHSCFYGTEYIERDKLVGANNSTEEMCELFNADSIRFLSVEDFEDLLPYGTCMACMTGRYDVDLGDFQDEHTARSL